MEEPRDYRNDRYRAPVPIALHQEGHYEELVQRAVESSLPTHGAETCEWACAALAVVLAALMRGVSKEQALDPEGLALGPLTRGSWAGLADMPPEIRNVLEGSYRSNDETAIRGSGYVVESLEAALWAFWHAHDARTALLDAVNLGEDADTTGAVCGQLVGAHYGESAFAGDLLTDLIRRDMIEDALRGLGV